MKSLQRLSLPQTANASGKNPIQIPVHMAPSPPTRIPMKYDVEATSPIAMTKGPLCSFDERCSRGRDIARSITTRGAACTMVGESRRGCRRRLPWTRPSGTKARSAVGLWPQSTTNNRPRYVALFRRYCRPNASLPPRVATTRKSYQRIPRKSWHRGWLKALRGLSSRD